MRTAGIIILSVVMVTAAAAFIVDFYARTNQWHMHSSAAPIIFNSYTGELHRFDGSSLVPIYRRD